MSNQLPTDLARQTEHLLTVGTVVGLNCSETPPVVKVRFDDEQVSDWMPFVLPRAGRTYLWMPPQIGEQGLVACLGGEMRVSFFIGGIFTEKNKPKDNDVNHTELRFANGDFLRHDAKTGKLTINCKSVEIVSDATIAGISFVGHVHGGVKRGKSYTNPPSGG